MQKLFLQRNIDRDKCDDNKPFLANLPSNAFRSLRVIYLDGVHEQHFGSNFKSFRNLAQITLSGYFSNCSVSALSNNTFENVPFITHMDLSNCNITKVDAGTFENLHELTHLIFSHNQGLGYSSLRNVSYGLKSTRIKVLDYSKVYKTFGVGTTLSVCM